MMCAGIAHLSEVLAVFADCGIHSLHIDVMDGCFVPNFTLGTDFCRRLRTLTAIPLDLHLMITDPEDKLDWFDIQPGEYVSVHAESTVHLHRALCRIRDRGAHPIAALNPATPLSALDYILDEADGVLIMAVNPDLPDSRSFPPWCAKSPTAARISTTAGIGSTCCRWTAVSALPMRRSCGRPERIILSPAPPACSTTAIPGKMRRGSAKTAGL